MKVKVFQDAQSIAEYTADQIQKLIKRKPECVLGLATGSTPVPTYREMIKRYEQGKLDFSQVKTYNLDEYLGLPKENSQSFYYFMWENLFSKINILKENTHLPSGTEADMESYCKVYEKQVEQSGGIDLHLLGIGNNGHIGFNEPEENFSQHVHIVSLTQETIQANKRFFENVQQVPRKAITMGIETIMKAEKIILIATGKAKAKAVYDTISGPVTPWCPASILQRHKDAEILLDLEAAALLKDDIFNC